MPLSVPAELAGVTGPCPRCGEVIVAPSMPEAVWPQQMKYPELAMFERPAPASVPKLTLPPLPSARSGGMSTMRLLFRNQHLRLAVLTALLVAPVAYYGTTNPSLLTLHPVALQTHPAGELHTMVSIASHGEEPVSITMAPRFASASHPPAFELAGDAIHRQAELARRAIEAASPGVCTKADFAEAEEAMRQAAGDDPARMQQVYADIIAKKVAAHRSY